jgi:hypothetical protein
MAQIPVSAQIRKKAMNHLKGMIDFFTVAPAQRQQVPPVMDSEVIMKDFSYRLPAIIMQSRVLTLQVVNQGSDARASLQHGTGHFC